MTIPDGPGPGRRGRRGGPPAPGGMTADAADARSRAAAALDANFAELIRWYASRPGGEVRRGRRRHHVLDRARLPLDQLRGRHRPRPGDGRASGSPRSATGSAERGMPWRWLVGPTSRPLDLGDRLLRAGFELVSDSAGMALDLDRLRARGRADRRRDRDRRRPRRPRRVGGAPAARARPRRGPGSCLARCPRPVAERRGPVARSGSRGSTASRSRRPPCSSRPGWPASTTSPPCPRPAAAASAAPSRPPRSPRPSRAASAPPSSARPRWATRSTAGSASARCRGCARTRWRLHPS